MTNKQTDLSKRLRSEANSPHPSRINKDDLRAAAEEIERYYTGMLNWKAEAERAPSAPAMPEGYVLLPKEATHEMCEAAHFGANCAEDALRASDREYWEEAYRDMVKAALSTPAVADVQEGWRERATKLITELDGIKVTDVARGHLKDTLAGKMGQLLRDLIAAPVGIVQAGKEHAAHCSLRFPATLNTEDDTCDCGAGKAAADGAGELPSLDDSFLDYHLNLILIASGSALRHYSMHKTKEDMRIALRETIKAAWRMK